MKKGIIALITIMAMFILAATTLAHTDGKAQPKVKITKKSPSESAREYTVTLTDSDSPEPVTGAKVMLTANMIDPHPMSLKPIKLKETRGGVYQATANFPMTAEWSISIKISSPEIVSTTNSFKENLISETPVQKASQIQTSVKSKQSSKISINWLSVLFSIIHLLFGVLWVGSHAFVILALKPFIIEPPSKKFLSQVIQKYSMIVGLSLIIVIVTGIYNAFFNIPAPLTIISSKPLGSLYLGFLMTKIGLVVLALIIGVYSATTIAPKIEKNIDTKNWQKTARSLLMASKINLFLGIGILAIAATLGYIHLIVHQL